MNKKPTPINKIEETPIKLIKQSPDNPRVITKAAIDIVAKSINRFGWQQPIVVDSANTIIAGHTRHLAAKELGLSTVPVVVADNLTPEEARAFRIADNRTGDFSRWDYPELVQQLDVLYDDFAEELALADWESISEEFDSMKTDSPGETVGSSFQPPEGDNSVGGGGADDGVASLSPNADAFGLASREFSLVVVCRSEGDAEDVQEILLNMEGVVDVRHKRN